MAEQRALPEREDDPTILNEENLLRRIPPWPNMTKLDHNTNQIRPSSAAFTDPSSGDLEVSSTHKERLLSSGGRLEDAIGKDRLEESGWSLVSLSCDFLRNHLSIPQKLVADPTHEDRFHTLIVGKKTDSVKRNMAKAAKIEPIPSR